VIYNPTAGKRRGARRLEPVRQAWGDRAAFWPTQRPGHGAELARQAAHEGFERVAAAGGDGTVHEVATGLVESGRADVRFVVIPIGSANDFAYSLFRSIHTPAARIDVGRARREDGVTKLFVCNMGCGFNGAVTVESRRVHWLQGTALYGLATLRALWRHFDCPPTRLVFDDRIEVSTPTLMTVILLGMREGGFLMAPEARLDDGMFDVLHVGRMSRWQVLRLLPRLAISGPPIHPAIRREKCRNLRIESERPVNVHVDGEFLCTAEEGFRAIDAEVIPAAIEVDVELSRRGGMPLHAAG
jgi:diacylglycerol kinase family enzyme